MANPRQIVRVSTKPYVYQGLDGYLVRWFDGRKVRGYFLWSRSAAQDAKSRAKQGKLPRGWAVKV